MSRSLNETVDELVTTSQEIMDDCRDTDMPEEGSAAEAKLIETLREFFTSLLSDMQA